MPKKGGTGPAHRAREAALSQTHKRIAEVRKEEEKRGGMLWLLLLLLCCPKREIRP